jgi:hypothetical protein
MQEIQPSRGLGLGSVLARYRAWERRVYAKKFGVDDIAGMDAYSNYFYSRKGWWIHAVELAATLGLAYLLAEHYNMRWWVALLVSAVLVIFLVSYLVLAWFTPRFYVKTFKFWPTAIVPLMFAGMLVGVLVGAMVKSLQTKGRIPTVAELIETYGRAAQEPIVWLILGCTFLWVVLLAAVARVRKQQLEQENALLTAASERDQAARAAAEAQLKVLQVQIKPHFLFNTLAAMQHWVDSKDDRAGPMLRNLTQFLRQSVSALDKPTVTVAEELDLVRSYLAIMGARMGNRLSYTVNAAEDVAALPIPPGLILTLTENALEHGITPALRGGQVHVSAGGSRQQSWIEVTDTGVGFTGTPQFNVGLRNTQERLATLYGEAAHFALTRDEAEGKTIARIDLGEMKP